MTEYVETHNINVFSYALFASKARPQALDKWGIFRLFKDWVIYLSNYHRVESGNQEHAINHR